MKTYKALIIDDVIDDIILLKIYLSKNCPNVVVVGQATNINDGIEQFVETNPDLLFLDINVEGQDPFMFLDSISNINSEVIFVSSYEKYGVKAIKYNVTGYILKPIDILDLKKTVNRAIVNLEMKDKLRNFEKNVADTKLALRDNYPELVAIPSSNKIDIIHVDYIVYLEADSRYTIFHLSNGSKKVASKNLGEYEKILNPKQFFRIHHRYIVNLYMITYINKSAGNYCELLNNRSLPIAKRRQDELHRFLNIK